MWELIQTNKRNSVILIGLMAGVLLGLGLIIGSFVDPRHGGLIGIGVALALWLILTLVSLSAGDQILLSASGAKPITHDVHPMLFNVVEEMTIAAGLPKMPRVYIINDPSPNAFAAGRDPQTASIAVTAGLLAKLDRDELQGVIAHEISHILHRDILYVTLAGVMLGTIILLSNVLLRGSMIGSSRRYSGGSRRGQGQGQAQAVLLVIALVAAILAPIMAQLLYYALSRRREYLADAGAARLTRYPAGLANALEKIARDTGPQLAVASKATAPMYIANPFKRRGAMTDLTSTHPPLSERIRILRGMADGGSYKDYGIAFTKVTGHRSVVPTGLLKDSPPPTSPARAIEQPPSPVGTRSRIGDIMRRANGFTFLTCPCGLKLKVPPNYSRGSVSCPRCKAILDLTRSGSGSAAH